MARTPSARSPQLAPRSPTQQQVHDLNLAVPPEQFERAMTLAARDMGGVYDRSRGVIRLHPALAHAGDPTFPYELEVHYRKFPCGMVMREVSENTPGVGEPCVSFDIIPRVPGDPRRSRVYKSFQGRAAEVKVLFAKFLLWLKVISKALHRYAEPRAKNQEFARVAQEVLHHSSIERVATKWLRARGVR